ncbi:hypothetical protein RchiOBHm_Chr2g0137131 [Rosa chinensis]|uniref:Uncharacterized protein n=1 Tax=Rosa chinensis TaxID=74649 RepID=A0A2P6RWI8_ROSCH|nr:hypothetical protein RchiOBHm_Chr2g0137131 [Rosa chinensis]
MNERFHITRGQRFFRGLGRAFLVEPSLLVLLWFPGGIIAKWQNIGLYGLAY